MWRHYKLESQEIIHDIFRRLVKIEIMNFIEFYVEYQSAFRLRSNNTYTLVQRIISGFSYMRGRTLIGKLRNSNLHALESAEKHFKRSKTFAACPFGKRLAYSVSRAVS